MNLQKDFIKQIEFCKQVMLDCGFEVPTDIKYSLNGRLSRACGRYCRTTNCKTGIETNKRIEISTKYFKGCIETGLIKEIQDTILHEMCHAMPDGGNHGAGWKQYTTVVNNKFGYHITTYADTNEVILSIAMERYVELKCTGCGAAARVKKTSRYAKNPHLFNCALCHSKFSLDK